MSNPQKLGQEAYLYYYSEAESEVPTDGAYDTTQDDNLILADARWQMLCVVDVTINRTRTLTAIVDRCAADETEYIAGRRETSIVLNVNEVRITDAIIRKWHQIIDAPGITGLLILNSDVADAGVSGVVGNFYVGQANQTQPSEGAIVNAVTVQPAMLTGDDVSKKLKRVYGASIA